MSKVSRTWPIVPTALTAARVVSTRLPPNSYCRNNRRRCKGGPKEVEILPLVHTSTKLRRLHLENCSVVHDAYSDERKEKEEKDGEEVILSA